jgi:hypothetical protein
MSESMANLVFNRYKMPDDAISTPEDSARSGRPVDYFSDETLIQLQQVEIVDDKTYSQKRGDKTAPQKQHIPKDLNQAVEDSIFGPATDWAYRGYIVHPLGTAGDAAANVQGSHDSASAESEQESIRLLDDRPPQPTDTKPRRTYLDSVRPVKLSSESDQYVDLILFNLLVALEWQPHKEDLRQLEWAFRRASDLLYDITDGCMAFGQVVFGGPALMECADIQVMASNRLLARTWVGGIHDEIKYMPIRLGRGVWHNVNLVTIPWDEPEAYRTLIHEWGHYALHLRDAYLDRIPLAFAGEAGFAHLHSQALIRAKTGEATPYTVVMPKIGRTSESIMETLEGTSELVARTDRSPDQDYEWNVIIKNYSMLHKQKRSFEGPGRLPLPLPRFGCHSGIGADQQPFIQAQAYIPAEEIELDRCWIYVVKKIDSANPRLIAQGTLDARSLYQPFPLLGADPDDTLVLIGRGDDRRPVVKRGEIAVVGNSSQITIPRWRNAAPDAFPVIEVLPEAVKTDEKVAQIRVRVNSAGGPPPDKVWIFPLGLADRAIELAPDQPIWISEPQDTRTLDGHVLALWGDQLTICTFSQGGNPSSGSPHAPPPISPGSSDGTVLLFFYDDAAVETNGEVKRASDAAATYYSRVKIITTLAHGIHGVLPPGARSRSQICSITSNAPLPLHLRPTLIMYYDSRDERDSLAGDLLICRLDNGVWTPLPTYLPPSRSFAVAPLDDGTAGSLSPYRDGLRAEFYMVCWIPRKE